MAQYSIFGMDTFVVSAGHEFYSHLGTKIIDVAGQVNFYAPFDCKVVHIVEGNGNTVVFESTQNVYTPAYPTIAKKVTFRCTHMNNTNFARFNYSIGDEFSQGELCYKIGNKYGNRDDGLMPNGTTMAAHIHLEFALGTFQEFENLGSTSNPIYHMVTNVTNNMLNAVTEACFIREGTTVIENDLAVPTYYVNQYNISLLNSRQRDSIWNFSITGTDSLDEHLSGTYLKSPNSSFTVYSRPNTNASVVKTVPAGGEVQIIKFGSNFESDGYQWAIAKYSGWVGYVRLDLKNDYLIRKAVGSSKIYLKAESQAFRIRAAAVNGGEMAIVSIGGRAEILNVSDNFKSDGYQWAQTKIPGCTGWSQMDTMNAYLLES